MEMSRLTRDGTTEPVSRDQILRRERGQVNINFPCLADYVQDCQPYPVDPYSCDMCDHTCVQRRGAGMMWWYIRADVLRRGIFVRVDGLADNINE